MIFTGMLLLLVQPAYAATGPSPTQDDGSWHGVCVGSMNPADVAYQVATIQGIQCLLANVLSIAVSGIGLVGFAMLIFGSFKILLAGSNTQSMESGKGTITLAVVGLIVALSAFIILNFIATFTGVNAIKNFQIPGSNTTFSG